MDIDADRRNFLSTPVEFESCLIPSEAGKCSLLLQIDIDPERVVNEETLCTFDNRTRFFPFVPKRFVKNGMLVDQDIEEQ